MLDKTMTKEVDLKTFHLKEKQELRKAKAFKKELRDLLELYGYIGVNKILIHLGENSGVKGGEITKYF